MLEGIEVLYHSSIRIEKEGKVIYFDPYNIEGEPKDADIIFCTHSHYDHFSPQDIEKVFKRVADFNTCDINTIIDSVRDKLIKELTEKGGAE